MARLALLLRRPRLSWCTSRQVATSEPLIGSSVTFPGRKLVEEGTCHDVSAQGNYSTYWTLRLRQDKRDLVRP
jgi:hypothetical protein